MILHSAKAHLMQEFDLWWYPENRWYCAMELYAFYYGDWDNYHGKYRWQRLSKAAMQCGIELQDTHRALADAELTRRIVLHMAKRGE
jgi:DNA polymerase III epsilon subunit-like protein